MFSHLNLHDLVTTWSVQIMSNCLSVSPSMYGSTALVDLGRFFSFLIYTQSVGLLGRGISQSQGRYLHTEQHNHRIKAHRQPCLEWDSNPLSQCLSGRRPSMPYTARPLWSANYDSDNFRCFIGEFMKGANTVHSSFLSLSSFVSSKTRFCSQQGNISFT
jgi:hypothetical protein